MLQGTVKGELTIVQ